MTTKFLAFIRQNVRAVKSRLAAFKPRALVWLTRHSTLFNKYYPTTPQRRFLIVKAKLIHFYQRQVEPKLAAFKAKLNQARQRVSNWLARRRRSLQVAAVVVVALMAGLAAAYLYQRSPALQRLGQAALATGAAILAAGWSLLSGRSSVTPAAPVVVTEPPRPAAVPVQPEPDGRLL
jgi:hypothetical protein